MGARGERLVAGHGDLRPEHVVLTETPICIDALDVEHVAVDPLDELAYLAVECERLGAEWAGALILGPWLARDPVSPGLIHLYQAFRSGLRAHLYAVRLADEGGTADERARWTERARSWLAVGRRHADQLGGRSV